ncbi:16S rRNA (guanine(966)-N(2))-methyltransferase RsmD [Beduinella massiliensis]|uniref:16S rRNA (guanine(966)-N(2))-methyltransferase RsmD n=1 Tax=Beduinella massiliensis TaxID=1852363 RepID=UPI0031F8EE4D
MRIISGSARGRTICAPQGMDTRPTQDYVRESLFNILRARVPEARVLDLFAGSGALGLEAVSRGAQGAVFVDSGRAAVQCVKKNVAALRMETQCEVLSCDWRAAIARLSDRAFDLVFMDPPYRMENTGEMCAALLAAGALAEDGLIVVEHRRGLPPALADGLEAADTRRYGDTEVTFVRRRQEEETP